MTTSRLQTIAVFFFLVWAILTILGYGIRGYQYIQDQDQIEFSEIFLDQEEEEMECQRGWMAAALFLKNEGQHVSSLALQRAHSDFSSGKSCIETIEKMLEMPQP